MPKPLPPLNAVRAFEAASRHLNLSRAAEELGVTQGAISKQVIALEDHIGAQLFHREPGGLRLTNEGGSLKEAIAPAFNMLGEAFSRYSRRPPRSNVCRISTTASFASQFLVPRLNLFRQRFPGIELEFLTTIRLVDLSKEEFDIAVRFGAGHWDGVVSTPIAAAELIAVCTPEIFERNKGDAKQIVMKERRIQSSAYNEWRDYAQAARIDFSAAGPTLVIEEFQVALTAACHGQGVALLPEILLRGRVRQGELKVFSDTRVKTDNTFYVVHPPNFKRSAVAPDVVAWLKEEASETL